MPRTVALTRSGLAVARTVAADRHGTMYAGMIRNDGPLRYWRCNEASGNLTDLVKRAIATAGGSAASYAQAGAILADTDTAIKGAADHLSSFTIANVVTGTTFSVEAWITVTGFTLGQGALIFQTNDSGLAVHSKSPGFELNWLDSATGGSSHLSGDTASLNTFHHVVVVVAAGALTFYIDGGLSPNSYSSISSSNLNRIIGDTATANNAPSLTMDEIAIYGYALSAAQILRHYKLGALGQIPARSVAA